MDFIATARTNTFRVRDVEAFRRDLARHGIEPLTWDNKLSTGVVVDDNPATRPFGAISLFSRDDHGCWPVIDDEDLILNNLGAGVACNMFAGDEGMLCATCGLSVVAHTSSDPYLGSIQQIVSAHLLEGDVAVFMEAGAEGFRYVGGVAVAVNSAGDTEVVALDDIYAKAASLGSSVTPVAG